MVTRMTLPTIMEIQRSLAGDNHLHKPKGAQSPEVVQAILSNAPQLMGQYALAKAAYGTLDDSQPPAQKLSPEQTIAVGTSISLLSMAGFHNEALCMEQFLGSVEKKMAQENLPGRNVRAVR